MLAPSATPVAAGLPAPREGLPERRACDRRADDRAGESAATVAVALARSAELECFDNLYRRDFHVVMWLTISTAVIYGYDLMLLSGRLTVS